MGDLPSFITIHRTEAETRIEIDLWTMTISLAAEDEDIRYFYASPEAAKARAEAEARKREALVRGRADAQDIRLTTRTYEEGGVEWKLTWWKRIPPAHEFEVEKVAAMKDYFNAHPNPARYCVLEA